MKGRSIVVINWPQWGCKHDAVNYIKEMQSIGLNCRIRHINDSEWNRLSAKFGDSVERGEA